jgi:prolyl-tRNA editing enzyme YbaK/EbsC (Cys-tRNA(Pro) deacylase)
MRSRLPASNRASSSSRWRHARRSRRLTLQCRCRQIAKSLVFRAASSGRAVLVIAAGDRRVNEKTVAERLGEPIERARPEFVREHSGFAIGGVAPLAHARPMRVFLDASLRRFDVVWAAGGTPHCVFPIPPGRLAALVAGEELDLGE